MKIADQVKKAVAEEFGIYEERVGVVEIQNKQRDFKITIDGDNAWTLLRSSDALMRAAVREMAKARKGAT